jgi:hypothetical protein
MAKIVQVAVRDGLMPNMYNEFGFVSEASYTMLFWCEIPDEWCQRDAVRDAKKDYILRVILDGLYGANWRAGNSDGSLFVVRSQELKLLSSRETAAAPWRVEKEGFRNWCCYVMAEEGQVRPVKCPDFSPSAPIA